MKVKDVMKTIKPTTRFRIFVSNDNKLTNWDEDEKENVLFKSWSNKAQGIKDFYDEDVIQLRPISNQECGYWVLDIQIKNKNCESYDKNKRG